MGIQLEKIQDPNLRAAIRKALQAQTEAKYGQPVAGLPDPERKPDKVQTLDGCHGAEKPSHKSVGICVDIISIRKKRIDGDNLQGGSKALRDSIARTLKCDDDDPRITWNYHQIVTKGKPGTQVLITYE